MGQEDSTALQDGGILGLQHPPTAKANTHQLRTGFPAYQSLPEPAAKCHHPTPSPLGCQPFPSHPPRQRTRPWERQADPAKERFNMLLTACLPRASDVCASRDMPPLRSPRLRFPIPVSVFKPTWFFSSPYFLGRKGCRTVSPSFPRRQKSPLLPKKRGPATPAPHQGHHLKALRAPNVTCRCLSPALCWPHPSRTLRPEGKGRISRQVNFSHLQEP